MVQSSQSFLSSFVLSDNLLKFICVVKNTQLIWTVFSSPFFSYLPKKYHVSWYLPLTPLNRKHLIWGVFIFLRISGCQKLVEHLEQLAHHAGQ